VPQRGSRQKQQAMDVILTRLDEIDKKLERLLKNRGATSTGETSTDEVTIVKGQVNKAENTVEKWFQQLRGPVIAELDFIDKTTFGYLDSIPKSCGLDIITSNVKEKEKCLRKARNCAKDRPYVTIVKINKVHERWLGSEVSFFVEIGTDLKSDALGHSTHTIRKLDPKTFRKRIVLFKEMWTKSQKKLRQIYGPDFEKTLIFSTRGGPVRSRAH
jgi:hypothetical protein